MPKNNAIENDKSYHGKVNLEAAESRLNLLGKDSFLIRCNRHDQYYIVLKDAKGVKEYPLKPENLPAYMNLDAKDISIIDEFKKS